MSEVVQACDACRLKKTKCSKETPRCSLCILRESECHYSPRVVRSPLTRENLTKAERRVGQLEDLIRSIMPSADINSLIQNNKSKNSSTSSTSYSQSSSPEPTNESVDVPTSSGISGYAVPIQPGANEQQQVLQFGSKTNSGAHHAQSRDNSSTRKTKREWREDDMIFDDTEQDDALYLDSGFFGESSLASLYRLFKMNKLMRPTNIHPEINSKQTQEPEINAVAATTVHSADDYVDAFFTVFHPTYPIVNERLFRSRYRSAELTRRSWGVLSNIILAIGAWCLNATNNIDDQLYYNMAKQQLSSDFFEAGSLEMVTGLSLMSSYALKKNRYNTACSYLGVAVRMGIVLGMHQEPSFPSTATLIRSEMRRRLWWGLAISDFFLSTVGGRPLNVPSNLKLSIHEVANIDESALHEDSIQVPTELTVPTYYSGIISGTKFIKKYRGLCETLICGAIGAPEASALSHDIDKFIKKCPGFYRTDAPVVTDNDCMLFLKYEWIWRLANVQMIICRPVLVDRVVLLQEYKQHSSITGTTELLPALTDEQLRCQKLCLLKSTYSLNLVEKFISSLKGGMNILYSFECLSALYQATLVPLILYVSYDLINEDLKMSAKKSLSFSKETFKDLIELSNHLIESLSPWHPRARDISNTIKSILANPQYSLNTDEYSGINQERNLDLNHFLAECIDDFGSISDDSTMTDENSIWNFD